ncbi:M14 family zinc carboxypeptidase [Candidatus Neomarinimicrobiota bacterium]
MTSKLSAILLRTALLPCLVIALQGAELQTSAELSGFQELTRHKDMMDYLRQLSDASKTVEMSIIGQSVEGRELPALFFSRDRSFGSRRGTKPMVMIFCQQHGNEPSGKEAALILARQLVGEQTHLLRTMDIILIPQVNPDGGEKDERQNANDEDLNRNHVILSEPETAALHRIFRQWMPEATLDVHEYNAITETWVAEGYVKDADEQLGGVTNVNISPEIISFTRDRIIPGVGSKIEAAGYSFHRYIVGSPFEDGRLRYSTTAINDGRQSLGIYNTFSFILEGKRYGDVTNMLQRRTQAQLAALIAFLEAVDEHQEEILAITSRTRQSLMNPVEAGSSPEVFIHMDYFPDSTRKVVPFPIFDLYTWKPETRDLAPFEPLVKPKRSISKPAGYIFSGDEKRLIDLLSKHGITVSSLKQSVEIEVLGYLLRHITTRYEEETEVVNVDAQSFTNTMTFKQGDIVILTNQPAGNLIPLMLEPHSSFSIVTENSGRHDRFLEYLVEGETYPVFRMAEMVDTGLLE